jgi:hypothetical protein
MLLILSIFFVLIGIGIYKYHNKIDKTKFIEPAKIRWAGGVTAFAGLLCIIYSIIKSLDIGNDLMIWFTLIALEFIIADWLYYKLVNPDLVHYLGRLVFISLTFFLIYYWIVDGFKNSYEYINCFLSITTLSILMIYNSTITKIQKDVKNIQEKELNFKLEPYLRTQYEDIYCPLIETLKRINRWSEYMEKDGYFPKKEKIDEINEKLKKIMDKKILINRTDFNRIIVIQSIFERMYLTKLSNIPTLPTNDDEKNKLRVEITRSFLEIIQNKMNTINQDLKEKIREIKKQEIFKEKTCGGFVYYPNDDELVFENGKVAIDNYTIGSDGLTKEHEEEIKKKNERWKKSRNEYEIEPILSLYFKNQVNYFEKIKNKIGEKTDELLIFDVSKLLEEDN